MVVRQNIDVDATSLAMLQKEFPEMTNDQAQKLERYSLYQNSDKGDVKGVQLKASVNLLRNVNLSANYTYTYARTNSGGEWQPLERSIRHAAVVAANYHHVWGQYRMNINMNGRLQSKTYYPDYEDAPGFGVWNLQTTHTFSMHHSKLFIQSIEPSLGVDNIFNRTDRRIDSSNRKYALYSPGRMVTVGLRIKFKD
jgi:outer membrane receptor for ferrienterochelin and colicins